MRFTSPHPKDFPDEVSTPAVRTSERNYHSNDLSTYVRSAFLYIGSSRIILVYSLSRALADSWEKQNVIYGVLMEKHAWLLGFRELFCACAVSRRTAMHSGCFGCAVVDVVESLLRLLSKVLEAIATFPNICRQLHLPAQSGSTTVLVSE